MKKFKIKELKSINTDLFYKIVLLSCLFGILAPLFKIFISLKYYENLHEKLNSFLYLPKINSIIADMVQWTPDYLIWNDNIAQYDYYVGWVLYNIICIISLIIFKKKIKNIFNRIIIYFSSVAFISYSVLFLIIIFQSKIFLGFIFSGIGGWDESNVVSNVYYPTTINKNQINQDNKVWKGINKINLRNQILDGCLDDDVILGYYKNQPYAINLSIAGIVFIDHLIGKSCSENTFPLLTIINHRQNKLHNLYNDYPLFFKLRYDEHASYMKLEDDIFANIQKFDSLLVYNVSVCNIDNDLFLNNIDLLKIYD
tara:strand:- start:5926 stop:6861 length:936 start_codon:yes stop_codon:yes gene_type:complete